MNESTSNMPSGPLGCPLAPAIQAELEPFIARPVGERQLDEIRAVVFRLLQDRCLLRFGYSLRGWKCIVWMTQIREPPPHEIALRDRQRPENVRMGMVEYDGPGRVQIVFVDPHGIHCDPETVELMAEQGWNHGLGWGRET